MVDVGEIVLDVSADGSGLPAEVRRAAEAAAKGVKIQVPADLQEKGLAAKVAATAKALSGLFEIEFEGELNTKRLAADIARMKAAAGAVDAITAPVELKRAWKEAAAEARRMAATKDLRIKATVDYIQAEKDLQRFLTGRTTGIKVPVEIDPRGNLLAQVQKLKRQIAETEAIRIELDIDAARQAQRLRGIVKTQVLGKLDDLRQQQIEIITKVKGDLTPIQDQLRDLNEKAKIEVDADATKAKIEFDRVKAEIESDDTVDIHLGLGANMLQARLESERFRNAINDNPIIVPMEINFDNRPFDRQLADMMRRLDDFARKNPLQRGDNFNTRFLKSLPGTKFLSSIALVGRYTAASISLIAGAIAVALPYIKALAVAIAQTAIQLLAAATAAGTFVGAGFLAIGAAAATATIGTIGLSNATDALFKIWTKQSQGVKVGKKDLEEYNQALRALSPSAREFVTSLDQMYPSLRKVQQAVQESLFKGLGDELEQTGRSVLPTVSKGFESIAIALNDMATNTLKWFQNSENVSKINDLFRISERTLRQMGIAAGNVAVGLLTLFLGSDENINSLGGSLVKLTERFKDWTDEVTKGGENSKWNKWLDEGREALLDLGGILGATRDIALGFWRAISGDPDAGFGDALESVRLKMEEWSAWFKDPANQQAIRDWVADAKADFDNLRQAVVNVANAINLLATAIQLLVAPPWGKGGLAEWINQQIAAAHPTWPRWLTDGDYFLNEVLYPFIERVKQGGRMALNLIGNFLKNLFRKGPIYILEILIDLVFKIDWPKVGQAFRDLLDEIKRRLLRGNRGGQPGASGGSWSITLPINPTLGPTPSLPNLPPIPWPVVPKLGNLPSLPNLPPIPWPILPKLGQLPSIPNLPPIPWPILPRFGPLPPFPILVPGLWPIISRYLPLPPPPTLPIRISRIISQWLPNPPPPVLPRRISRIISEWAPIPKAPYVPPIYVPIIGVRQGEGVGVPIDAKGEIVNGASLRIIGEAGPEAVVPLSRTQPLDPGVRALLQAVAADRGMMSQPTSKGKDRLPPNINVTLPTGDPEAAAMAVYNRLVFEGAL